MKTPYYPVFDDSEIQLSERELREKRLVKRLSTREDVREILLVMTPALKHLQTTKGDRLMKRVSEVFHSNLSHISHWAINIGDNYFELHRIHSDLARTELSVSKWSQERKELISHTFPQGVTALDDREIIDIGQRYFSQLNRMHINKYDVWKNNCHVAVDNMLHEIGGLSRHRENLKSMEEWTRQFFCNSMMIITRLWYRVRGCDEAIIEKHEHSLRSTLEVLTPVTRHYPKRQWIREDMNDATRSASSKLSVVGGHWYLSVIESSLSLRKQSEASYVKPGADGKPELRFDLVQEAVKGIWNGNEASKNIAWLKALPWLTGGFVAGTLRWAFAVIYLVCESGKVKLKDGFESGKEKLKDGLDWVLINSPASSKLQDAKQSSSASQKRKGRNSRRRKLRSKFNKAKQDSDLVERYERRTTSSGASSFFDRMNNTEIWDAPEQQELCLRITDVPISKRWEERQEGDGPRFYIHSITGEIRDSKPGPSEVWVVKKRVETGWVKSSIMPLPAGWELCRTDTGEPYYMNHSNNPPISTSMHPIVQEIEDERKILLPEWNVEWDEERGKKYRNMQTQEIHWKAVDGPRHNPEAVRPKLYKGKNRRTFIEPLPYGWTSTVNDDGKVMYINPEKLERRTTHPYHDKRRRLLPQWEMRYTEASRRYWVHYGLNGRGTTWWTRNKLVKNTTLENNACGWKQTKGGEWEWFEGGDAPHSGIPLLDLDDPAEFEFREYPMLSANGLQASDGSFLEPLPHDWILRRLDSGVKYYYNFKTKTPSSEHPYEKVRQDLPALWEMRWTRYGKPYYVNHSTGLTWWTNPCAEKHEQKLRGDVHQKQDGWKWDEDNDCWVYFQEVPQHETTDETSSKPASPESGSIDGDLETERRHILAQTREWLKDVNAHELLGEVQGQLKEQGNQKLAYTAQWLKDRGGKLGEDKSVMKMHQWMKERSVSETLGTLKREIKARQSYVHSLSTRSLKKISKEKVGAVEGSEPGADDLYSTTQQTSDLPTPAHHKNEDTAGDYFLLEGLNMEDTNGKPAPDSQEPPHNFNDVGDSPSKLKKAASNESLEFQPSTTSSNTKKEKFSVLGQHIKDGRDILTRHASGMLAQKKAEIEEKLREKETRRRLASEQKLAKEGQLDLQEILPPDKEVESLQDGRMKKDVGQETNKATSVDTTILQGQSLSKEVQADSARETCANRLEDQSPTAAALSTSSTIANDAGSTAEEKLQSQDILGTDTQRSSADKSILGKVNVLLAADNFKEGVSAVAEGGRKKWLRKAWAKV